MTGCHPKDLTTVATRNLVEHREAADAILAPGSGWAGAACGGGALARRPCSSVLPRGRLAYVRPMWHPRVLPLLARRLDAAEREPGLGRASRSGGHRAGGTSCRLLDSGHNPYPVEVAQVAAERGPR